MSFGYFKEIRWLLDMSAEINVIRTGEEVKYHSHLTSINKHSVVDLLQASSSFINRVNDALYRGNYRLRRHILYLETYMASISLYNC